MADTVPAAAKNLYGTMDAEQGEKPVAGQDAKKFQMGWIGMTMILFFNVSGGPFMSEDFVGAAGPLFAILGILLVALLYAVPCALMSSEMSTTYPEDAGVVAWVTAAFGPTCGFTQGTLFWLQGVLSLPPYCIMFVDYVKYAVCPPANLFASSQEHCPALDHRMLSFLPTNGTLVIIVFVLSISWLNWRGLRTVTSATIVIVAIVLLPFIVMCVAGLPHLHPIVWTRDRPFGNTSVEWATLLSSLFWCFNYWDSASTLAGEVDQPQQAIPSASLTCVCLCVANTLLPIAICTAALPSQTWATGFWVEAGFELGGHLLEYGILAAALLSFCGQFLAGQATISYELLGMAELGQLSACFAGRNSHGAPTMSLILSVFVVFLVLYVSGANLTIGLAIANSVYALVQFPNWAAFLLLRFRDRPMPSFVKPFRIPLGFAGCVALAIFPIAFNTAIIVSPFWNRQWIVVGFIFVAVASSVVLYTINRSLRQEFPHLMSPLRDPLYLQDNGAIGG